MPARPANKSKMSRRPGTIFPTRKWIRFYDIIPADDPYVLSRSFRGRLRDQSVDGRAICKYRFVWCQHLLSTTSPLSEMATAARVMSDDCMKNLIEGPHAEHPHRRVEYRRSTKVDKAQGQAPIPQGAWRSTICEDPPPKNKKQPQRQSQKPRREASARNPPSQESHPIPSLLCLFSSRRDGFRSSPI